MKLASVAVGAGAHSGCSAIHGPDSGSTGRSLAGVRQPARTGPGRSAFLGRQPEERIAMPQGKTAWSRSCPTIFGR
ncbi:MAG: hypothetical protein JXB85_13125 [Anaerolineales bacterium]|nr:hypothetical protein [Anaerolineales bacterium]